MRLSFTAVLTAILLSSLAIATIRLMSDSGKERHSAGSESHSGSGSGRILASSISLASSSASSASQAWIDEGALPAAEESSSTDGGDSDPLVSFTLLLRQRNKDELDKKFKEVSDPASPSYAQYLSKGELDAMINPSVEEQQQVINFIHSSIPSSQRQHPATLENKGDAIVVRNVKAREVEKAFACRIHRFKEKTEHSTGSRTGEESVTTTHRVIYRCVTPIHLPSGPMSDFVEGVIGLLEFPPLFRSGPHPHPHPHPYPYPTSGQPALHFPAHRPPAHGRIGGQQPNEATSHGHDQPASSVPNSASNPTPTPTPTPSTPSSDLSSTPIRVRSSTHPIRPPITFRTPEQLAKVVHTFQQEMKKQERKTK